MKKPAIRNPKPKPGWDLYVDGISYSLLSKFVVCRERFRIATVEMYRSSDRKDALDFGTMFHKALELYAGGKTTMQITSKLMSLYKDTGIDIMLVRQVALIIPHYVAYYSSDNFKYVSQEEVFDVPYKSQTNGRPIRIRGRWDEVFVRNGKLWLQENKTKSDINRLKITQTLPFDLQTMLYCYTLSVEKKKPIGGVLYNVIRKPNLVQGKTESDIDFLNRINEDISKRPDHYFFRSENDLTAKDITDFARTTLFPLIEAVVVWWESIKNDPMNPWVTEDGKPNPNHYARPFGVFDPMSIGLGDFFEYITTGLPHGLVRKETCFPELQGEQGVKEKEVREVVQEGTTGKTIKRKKKVS
jgi:hypothetical protein